MNNAHRSVAMLIAFICSLIVIGSRSTAQNVVAPDCLLPHSSLQIPGDIGLRAHTHMQVYNSLLYPRLSPNGGKGPASGFTPTQMRSFYSLPSTGGSQIIAIVDAYDDPNALSDFNTFASYFSLPVETSSTATASTNKVFQVVYTGGTKPGTDPTGGWELEEAMDIEWAHAMAPSAKILLVEAQDNSYVSLFAAVSQAASYVDGNAAAVREVSCSWGGSEWDTETSYDSYLKTNNVVFFTSAGDSGAPAQYPSASPYAISVGGTTVNTNNSGSLTSEVAWNSSGGGPSAYEAISFFQSGISSIVGTSRGTPDIAFDANPSTGASVYDSYIYEGSVRNWQIVGGTSLACPCVAGAENLAATAQSYFPVGSQAVLATIYKNLGTSHFRDITSGNNGHAAAVGWDYVTGVGTPIGLVGLQPVLPTITSISPTTAVAGAPAFSLTVNGTGYVSGSTISWNGTALTTTFVSSTKLTASVSATQVASAGSVSVTVVNSGPVTSSASTFTVSGPPVISSLSPASTLAGGSTFTLTVNGSGFVSGATVNWNGTALTTSFVSTSQLTASVSSASIAAAGSSSITVTDPGPVTSSGVTFSYTAPAISNLSPNSAIAGSPGFTLTVNGTSFASTSLVKWGGTSLATTFVSSTQLTATVSAAQIATAGTASVTVVNPGSVTSGSSIFSINAQPTVSSLSPASTLAGGSSFTLTVNGSGFVSGATVNWNGTALTTSFISSSQLTASVPASSISSPGSASISVSDPGPVMSGTLTFTFSGPTISSISPNFAIAGEPGFTLSVSGSNFASGAVVKWNGTSLTTTFASSSSLTAIVPASLIAAPGTASVTAVNPGAVSSGSSAFTIGPSPVITSLSPSFAVAGRPTFSLTVNGSGFVSGSTVTWNGTTLTTSFGSSSQLTASVPASLVAAAGSASIAVVDPGPVASAATPFAVIAPPVISNLSPNMVIAGAASFTLTVNGTGFVSGAAVQWNGSALTTTYVSASQLTAVVPAPLIASAGSASVTVVVPGPITSAPATLTILAAPVILSLSPGSAQTGGPAFTLTVIGTGFTNSSVVRWNGASLVTTYVSASQLTAAVPAPNITRSGSNSITVYNPAAGGSTSNTALFLVGSASIQTAVLASSRVSGSIQIHVQITNVGTAAAAAAQLTGAVLLSSNTTTAVPINLGTLAPNGGTTTITLTFPNVGVSGTPNVKLKIAGSFTGGSYLTTTYITLP